MWPEDIYKNLYPYQEDGVRFLAARRRGLLLDGMGLGKSPQAIRSCDAIGARKVLVICAAIAKENWARLFKQWGLLPRTVSVIDGTKACISASIDIVIVNYDLLRYYSAALGAIPFDVAIVDEAQYLKSPAAARTKHTYGAGGALSSAKRVWILTGTLCRNHTGESWTHIRALFPKEMDAAGIPREYEDFLDMFTTSRDTPYGRKITGSKNTKQLAAFLAPLSLRRRQEDVLKDLPPLRFEDVVLPGGTSLAELAVLESGEDLSALAARWRACGLDDEAVQTHISSLLAHAAQSSTFRRLSGLAKVKPVAEMLIEDLGNGVDKILVGVHHKAVLEGFRERLEKFGVVSVSGASTPRSKNQAIDTFNNDPNTRVFLGNLDACATSVDLVGCAEVVMAECSWTPSDNLQFIKRTHRIGQLRPVRVRFPSLAGTIDEAVSATLRRKTKDLADLDDLDEQTE